MDMVSYGVQTPCQCLLITSVTAVSCVIRYAVCRVQRHVFNSTVISEKYIPSVSVQSSSGTKTPPYNLALPK